MKKSFRIFTVLIAVMTLFFFIAQCSGGNEKTGEKQGNSQKQADAQKVQPKKNTLPKKLLTIDLTAEQKTKCEALYKEVFTPEILAERSQVVKKMKGLKKDSEEFIKLKKEIGEKMKPYNAKFNEKLKEILTPEQQAKYFTKTEK
jgi:Spy/CpxP family protein refolding chaperone